MSFPSQIFISKATTITATWLQAVNDLSVNLLDGTNANNGPGMIPYSAALSYPAGSVGAAIKASSGGAGGGLTSVIDVTLPPYSAPTDGVTLAATAIQAAINYAVANKGGVIWIPAGTYNLGTTGLTLPGSVVLWGAGGNDPGGKGSTLAYSGTGDAVSITGNYNNVRGIAVTSASNCHSAFSIFNGTKNVIRDCGFSLSYTGAGASTAGIFIGGSGTLGSYWNLVDNCNGVATTPLVMSGTGTKGSVNANTISNCLLRSNVASGGLVVFMNGAGTAGVGNNLFLNSDFSYYGTGASISVDMQGLCGSNTFVQCYIDDSTTNTGYFLSGTGVTNTMIFGGYVGSAAGLQVVDSSHSASNFFAYQGMPLTYTGQVVAQSIASSQSPNRGDVSVTLTVGTDAETQFFASALTANRTVTLATAFATVGSRFRIVRTGLGSFTLTVQTASSVTLKILPSATAAWADFEYGVSGWALTAYGTL